MDNKVSIITPLYNLESYISESIESVLAQSYQNFELIIVDDFSTDTGPDIVRTYCEKDKRIVLLKNKENSGPAISRNNGIRLANGRYLTFLDGDDVWLPTMIEKSLEMLKSTNSGFVFASYKRYDEHMRPLLSDFIVPPRVTYYDILKSNPISCLTAFIDIQKLGKKYMPLIRKRQDLGLWLNYLKEIDHAVGIQETLAIYRIRKDSLSRNKFSALRYQWEVYRNLEKLGVVKSSYYLVHWIIRGLIKYRR